MRRSVAILALLALAACAPQKQASKPAAVAQPAPGAPPAPAATPAPAPDVPHIYMALQPSGGGGAMSVVFAIDRERDNTPTNDPAIRITPEDGKCNPQELRRFDFQGNTAERPIFGPQEATSGISARELPNFMAMAVTSEMMRQGLIVEPDASKPQNVCTRKLWEQLIVNQSTSASSG